MSSIDEWLERLGLGRYKRVFSENDIDFEVLRHLSDDHLTDLGLTLGHRLKLRTAIEALHADEAPDRAAYQPARPDEPQLDAAEHRQLTVMFCDLVGSTALSTRLDAEDYRDLIRAYQNACASVVVRFEGFIAKFMGDGVLVYFGWPRAHEDDAERAINAGLGVVEAVRSLAVDDSAPLAVRIGIATGHVVVGGIIGDNVAQEAMIAGEAPNLAARLQAIAEPNTVVIAEATHTLAGTLFECSDLGAQALKGFETPVGAWQVDALRAIESRFEAMRSSVLTPFVGREEEIEILERRWKRACAGDGQVVLLSGEPGIGKSRIVSALRERIGVLQYTPLLYQCSPYHTSSALHPVIIQLLRAAKIQSDDSAGQKLDKLEVLLERSGRPTAEAVPPIAQLLSIPFSDRYTVANVTPQRQKQLTLAALVDQLAGLTERQPVLFHFEDAHWIDPTSRELIELMVARAPKLRALIIISFRPDFVQNWVGEPHVTLLALNRLDARICANMATLVGSAATLPDDVIHEIALRSDGIPLFIEEMTKTVLESDVPQEGAAPTHISISIPASIEDSLMARLDRLGPVKEVAQIAAVLGRSFSHEMLAAVVELDDAELVAALDSLVAAELVYRRAVGSGVVYEFKHVLVQDAAYQSLLKRSRQRHHANIARVLQSQFPDLAEPELLGHHYSEAGQFEQAIDHWLEAGRRAMQRSAHVEAEDHLRKGLNLLERLPATAERDRREIALQNTLGVCMMPTRGFGDPDVAAAFSHAVELCEKVGDARGLFVALRGKGQYNMISGDMRTACSDTSRILNLAKRTDDHDFLIEAHHLGWSAFCFHGDFQTARNHAEEGIARYDRKSDHHLTYVYSGHDPGMCCRAFGSLSLCQLGYPDQALDLCREGLDLAESLAHPFTVAIALWATGILHQLRREPEAAGEAGDRMINYCSDKGLLPLLPLGEIFLGDALARQGKHAQGINLMCTGMAKLQETSSMYSLPSFFPALANAYLSNGDIDEGLAALEKGLALVKAGGDRFSLPEIHRAKAALLLAHTKDNRDAAEAALGNAIKVARGQQARLLELRAAADLARLWCDRGRRRPARELLSPIYAGFTEGFETRDLQDAKMLLNQLN